MDYLISYVRDEQKRPVITRAVAFEPETGDYYFGAAFCSPKDHPTKRIGRSIAVGRAQKAAWFETHGAETVNIRGNKFAVAVSNPTKQFLTDREFNWVNKRIYEDEKQIA